MVARIQGDSRGAGHVALSVRIRKGRRRSRGSERSVFVGKGHRNDGHRFPTHCRLANGRSRGSGSGRVAARSHCRCCS